VDSARLGLGRDPDQAQVLKIWSWLLFLVMTRIAYARREELGPEGQQLWDNLVNNLGDLIVTADGALAGPFNAFVTAPEAGRRLSSLGATLRFGTSIERRLSEIAIITVAARWQAEFEWWAHAPMACEHGVAGAVVDAIGCGDDPPFEADDERAVYLAARQLALSGRLDQQTFGAAHRFLGDAGMVELVSLCGYYTLISFLLNALAVPLPPDAAPMWAGS
jgi:4-carboxymuconolactone decarboxylase